MRSTRPPRHGMGSARAGTTRATAPMFGARCTGWRRHRSRAGGSRFAVNPPRRDRSLAPASGRGHGTGGPPRAVIAGRGVGRTPTPLARALSVDDPQSARRFPGEPTVSPATRAACTRRWRVASTGPCRAGADSERQTTSRRRETGSGCRSRVRAAAAIGQTARGVAAVHHCGCRRPTRRASARSAALRPAAVTTVRCLEWPVSALGPACCVVFHRLHPIVRSTLHRNRAPCRPRRSSSGSCRWFC